MKGPVAALSGFAPVRWRSAQGCWTPFWSATSGPDWSRRPTGGGRLLWEPTRTLPPGGRADGDRGRLVALSGEYRVHQKHHERALEILYRLYGTADVISLARFRDACGVSRGMPSCCWSTGTAGA